MLAAFADDDALFRVCDKSGRLPIHMLSSISYSHTTDSLAKCMLDRLEAKIDLCSFRIPPPAPKRKRGASAAASTTAPAGAGGRRDRRRGGRGGRSWVRRYGGRV